LTEKAGNADKVEEAFFDKLSVFWVWIGLGGRVTRLGEFWPLGRLFILGSFFKLQKKCKSLGYSFPTVKDMY
jgi:hypothetical protein